VVRKRNFVLSAGFEHLLWAEQQKKEQKNGSFSLIERVILSAGAMLIFSVSFQLTKCPKTKESVVV
jgi:hypothetical protein